jgi:hypothetical protein
MGRPECWNTRDGASGVAAGANPARALVMLSLVHRRTLGRVGVLSERQLWAAVAVLQE